MIIGAMKGGTTSLWEYLSRHPEVFVSDPKELDFFVAGNWERGLEWYESHFEGGRGRRAVGEASTAYTKHPLFAGVPERMAATIPDARLIYLVRDPVPRMRSEYLHEIAIRREPAFSNGRVVPIGEVLHPDSHYVAHSRYWMQIERYLSHFPRARLLVLTSESLLNDRRRALRSVLEFLEVDADWYSPAIEREFHRTEQKRRLRGGPVDVARRAYKQIDRALPERVRRAVIRAGTAGVSPNLAEIGARSRQELEDAVRPDVAALRELLGPSFTGWGLLDR